MTNSIAFVSRLISVAPELLEIYKLHLNDYDTVLPHVFMGDIARQILLMAKDKCKKASLSKLLTALEEGLKSGDEEICELISVSFVENLCGEALVIERLLPQFGIELRREFRTICGV
jgi:hypothetical protein